MSSNRTVTPTCDNTGLRILVEVHSNIGTCRRYVCNGFYKNQKPCLRPPRTCRFNVNDPSTQYCKIHQAQIPPTPPTCASDHVVYKATASHHDDLLAGHCPVCQTKRTVYYTTNNPWCWDEWAQPAVLYPLGHNMGNILTNFEEVRAPMMSIVPSPWGSPQSLAWDHFKCSIDDYSWNTSRCLRIGRLWVTLFWLYI